jgi:hypothetical protein
MTTPDLQPIIDGKFAMNNPDVMHTGGQYRTIIEGLLQLTEVVWPTDEKGVPNATAHQPKPMSAPPMSAPPALPPMGPNEGHGHVWRRHDGRTARCGGPSMCHVCAAQLTFVLAKEAA